MKISSLQNENVKRVSKLRESKGRREYSQFAVEGLREIRRACEGGWKLQELFVCPEILDEQGTALFHELGTSSVRVFEVSRPCFSKLAMRSDSGGLLAVFALTGGATVPSPPQTPRSLFLLLEGIEKPGNVGALIRTADGAGVSAIFTMDCQADIFHPHVIRTSLGCCFTMPVVSVTREQALEHCKKAGVMIYAAMLSPDAVSFRDVKFSDRRAILLGSEDLGLSKFWHEHADVKVTIPMRGQADSLNVAAAGAILLFHS